MTTQVGLWLQERVNRNVPNATAEEIVRLQFSDNEALVWIIVKTLHYCWNQRKLGKRSDVGKCKADLIADCNLMRSTKHHSFAEYIESSFLQPADIDVMT